MDANGCEDPIRFNHLADEKLSKHETLGLALLVVERDCLFIPKQMEPYIMTPVQFSQYFQFKILYMQGKTE
ncbi:hypothetical protein EAF04_009045 [Stromatinia cepivora]|nr:hypothetical protein EAF04_009045 [Stromatinia cepivora]